MNKIVCFLNKNRKWIVTGVTFLTPIVAGVFFCLLQGMWIGDLYLPTSFFNDEILYYKQIEGVLDYGVPQGYFGYNESTAAKCTFSAWSPVILSFYALWGKIFGWGYSSPILCNVFFISSGLAFFSYKSKLDYKQMGLLSAFVILFTPLTRYMLSCMSDGVIVFVMLLYLGFFNAVFLEENLSDKQQKVSMLGMLVCSCVLTLMRPYFFLLFCAPLFWGKRVKLQMCIWAVSTAIASLGLYAVIAKIFTAEYFFPLINTEWLKDILSNPIEGIKNAVLIFLTGLCEIGSMCKTGISSGGMAGGLWAIFILVFVLVAYLAYKNRSYLPWLVVFVLLLGAIVMFYDIGVGSRHLIPFVLLGIVLLCSCKWNNSMFVVLAAVLVLFTTRLSSDYGSYLLPVYDPYREEIIATISNELEEKIEVKPTGDPWDNTVIWLSHDVSTVTWQNLYALPSGMGINMCKPEYVLENLEDIKSKYIVTNAGERIDLLLEETDALKILQVEGFAVWQLRE